MLLVAGGGGAGARGSVSPTGTAKGSSVSFSLCGSGMLGKCDWLVGRLVTG